MKTPPWVIVVIVVVIAFLLWPLFKENGVIPPREQVAVAVDCRKQSLADQVDQISTNSDAREFVFVVAGECEVEKAVTITNDNVTIKGEGRDKTIITGIKTEPVIEVIGATGVTLTAFTVKGGEHGILVEGSRKRGAEVTITDVNAQENEKTGLCVLGPEPTPEPSKAPSGKTRPYHKAPASSEEGDRCVADLEPSEEPVGQAPRDQKEPLSSANVWNALIPDATAQTAQLVVTTSTTVCNGDYHGPSAGINVNGPGVTLTVSGPGRCDLRSNENGTGLRVMNGSTVSAINASITLTRNANFGLRLLGGSAHLATNSSADITQNAMVDISGSPTCDATSRITTTAGPFSC